MRALIEARLATAVWRDDPTAQFLARVEGEVSPALLQVLERPRAAAAVLLGLVERRDGLTVLFTERAVHLRDHPGQISLPGGRIQPQDAGATAAALREAQEEVGLAPSRVAVVGCLAPHVTGTGFLITPVVGFIEPNFEAAPDVTEVASVFETPLEFVLDPRNWRSAMYERLGSRFRIDELQFGPHRIWGATAAILGSFRELLLQYKTDGYHEYR
jgi:8-oxo-dGTP pyrophosphatase MutT (NUDIX family)